MTRTRVSTTVDDDLLSRARKLRSGGSDAALIDAALTALLASYRRTDVDASYEAAYALHPIDEPDAWGDLAKFREVAGAS